MKSKLEQYKQELSELMETKNDPDTPSDIKESISSAIDKLKSLIKEEEAKGDKAEPKKESKPKSALKKVQEKVAAKKKQPEKKSEPAKKSLTALDRCREIIAKYNDKKKADAKRVKKRVKAGKPVELTPAETIKKAASSVRAKVVEMDKGLKASEETSIISGIVKSVVSAMAGIKDPHRKKQFLSKIIENLSKLNKNIKLRAEDGMYVEGAYMEDAGGEMENDMAETIRKNIISVRHHTDEILASLKQGAELEHWLINRSARAATDLSDVAHFLDGTVNKMASGGEVKKEDIVILGVPRNKITEKEWQSILRMAKYQDGATYILKDEKGLDVVPQVEYEWYLKEKMASGGEIKKGDLVKVKKYGWIMRVDEIDGNMYFLENDKEGMSISNKVGNVGGYLKEDIEKLSSGGYMADGGEVRKYRVREDLLEDELKVPVGKDYVGEGIFDGKYVGDHFLIKHDGKWGKAESIDFEEVEVGMAEEYVNPMLYNKMASGGYMAKGGEVKVGDIIESKTGVKVKVVEFDPKFGGRIKVERMDEYATGKPSQFLPLKNFNFAAGGVNDEGGVDLFEDYENIPANVQEILENNAEALEGGDYRDLERVKNELEAIGYTYDYYLDGTPYDLRKIGQKGKSETEEDEFARGGYNYGRSWHLDRARHNKGEDWEVRRRGKYAEGGEIDSLYSRLVKEHSKGGYEKMGMSFNSFLKSKMESALDKGDTEMYYKLIEVEKMYENDFYAKGGEIKSASYETVVRAMKKDDLMKAFVGKVPKKEVITYNDLEEILPDYISGADIRNIFKYASGGYMADGGKVLVGKFNEKQLRDGEDKKAIEKAMKETGLKFIDSKIIKKNGKPHMMEVYLYAKGGGIYSSDSLYILKVSKDGKEVGEERFRAKNIKEARELGEEYEEKYKSKFGGDLSYSVRLAESKMAKGGRTLAAIMKDRKYKSDESWEKSYKRKGTPKNPKYKKYEDGGMAKGMKKYPSLENTKTEIIN